MINVVEGRKVEVKVNGCGIVRGEVRWVVRVGFIENLYDNWVKIWRR